MLIVWLMRTLTRLAPTLAGHLAWRVTLRTARPRGSVPPGQVADRFVADDVGEVVVFRTGPEHGPRALLIHGWNGSAADWTAIAGALADAGHSVTVLDMPGHGASAGRRSSLARFVRALRETTRRHGPFDLWIAHSMGVAAALAVLASGVPARRVAFISGLADPAGALRGFARAVGLNAAGTRAYLASIEHHEKMQLDELDGARNGARIDTPALIVHDRADRVVPVDHGERLARALPRATLVHTEGLGHRRILSDATIVQQLVTFARH